MAKVKKSLCLFIVFKYFKKNICVIESDHLNKKNNELVASKHFGHVTFYAADEESGSIRQ